MRNKFNEKIHDRLLFLFSKVYFLPIYKIHGKKIGSREEGKKYFLNEFFMRDWWILFCNKFLKRTNGYI